MCGKRRGGLQSQIIIACFIVCSISGDMTESKAKKIEIKDVDGLTLSKLIDYIYTAEIEVTEENVQVRRTLKGYLPITMKLTGYDLE